MQCCLTWYSEQFFFSAPHPEDPSWMPPHLRYLSQNPATTLWEALATWRGKSSRDGSLGARCASEDLSDNSRPQPFQPLTSLFPRHCGTKTSHLQCALSEFLTQAMAGAAAVIRTWQRRLLSLFPERRDGVLDAPLHPYRTEFLSLPNSYPFK